MFPHENLNMSEQLQNSLRKYNSRYLCLFTKHTARDYRNIKPCYVFDRLGRIVIKVLSLLLQKRKVKRRKK